MNLQTSQIDRYQHIVFPDVLASPLPDFFPSAGGTESQQSDRTAAPPFTDDELSLLRSIFAASGISMESYRHETLSRRLPACLRALRVGTALEARRQLRRNPAWVDLALKSLVIGITEFFRDGTPFEALRNVWLPKLAVRGAPLRIWSAGCSNGAEVYSLAMLLTELGLSSAFVLGTDCRCEAIRNARAGIFPPEAVNCISKECLPKYFQPAGRQFAVCQSVKQMCRFRAANVLDAAEPGPWDLILCRNLAIYLKPAAAADLWRRLRDALRPGGILLLGKAERPLGTSNLRPIAPMLYQRD